ncbi:nestin [Protopterus annectens]|uniref:nestin n=1 Tax=Protopterus annectens TaxID=7888 RepID=UPI001CFBDB1D|nr:nestin [Protopterus annectens]
MERSMRRNQTMGTESQQMYELNKRLEGYLSRVKFLEQENELLKEEIQELQLEQSKTSWKNEYQKELRALRESLDELYRDKSQTELERDRMYDELLLMKDRWQKEKQEQELVKQKVKESKQELEEETRAHNWLKQKAFQLEDELQLLQDAHEEEKLSLQQEVSERSYSFTELRPAHTPAYPAIEVQEYTSQLSEIWKGAVRSYQEEIDQMEASLQDAKDQLQSIAREKKEAYQLLQNLQRELDSLQVRKEMLEKSVMKHQQEQQDCRHEFQSEIDSMEDEKEELRQQIVQILKDRQKLMELKMSLSLEVATYRSLLEAESIRLQPFMEYSPASVIRDTKLDIKSNKPPSLPNNITDVRRKFGSTESRINLTSMHRGVSATPQLPKSQPELLKTTLVNKFQGTTSLSKNLHKEPTARLEPAMQRGGISVTQRSTSKRDSSTVNSVKTLITTAEKETISESYSHDSSKPLGYQPMTYETKFPKPSDKPDHVDERRYTNSEEKLTTRVEVKTEKKDNDLNYLVKTDKESYTVSPAEIQINQIVQDTYYSDKQHTKAEVETEKKDDDLAYLVKTNKESDRLIAAETQLLPQTEQDTHDSEQLITEALDKAFETLKGAGEDTPMSSAITITTENVTIKQNESVNEDFSYHMEDNKNEVVPQSFETLSKTMPYDNWENRDVEITAELLENDKETEIDNHGRDDQYGTHIMSIESDIPEPSLSIPVYTQKTEDAILDMTSQIESEQRKTMQVTSESFITVSQEVRFTTSSDCKDIDDDATSAHVYEKDSQAFSSNADWHISIEPHKHLETVEKDPDSFKRNHVSSDETIEDTDEMVTPQHVIKSFSTKLLDGGVIQEVESIPEQSKDSNDFFRSDEKALEDMEKPADAVVTNGKEYDEDSMNINSAEVSDANRPADDVESVVLHKQKVEEIFSSDESVKSEIIVSEKDDLQYGDDSIDTTLIKEEWPTERKPEDSHKEDNISEIRHEEDINQAQLLDMIEPSEGTHAPFSSCDAEVKEPVRTTSAEEYFTVQHIAQLSKSVEVDSVTQPNKDISEGEVNMTFNLTETELFDGREQTEDITAEEGSRVKDFVLDDMSQQEDRIDNGNVVSYHEDESRFETQFTVSLNDEDIEVKEQEKYESRLESSDESVPVTDIHIAAPPQLKEETEETVQEDLKSNTEMLSAVANSDENTEKANVEECLYLNKEHIVMAEEKKDKEETEEMEQPRESGETIEDVQEESEKIAQTEELEESNIDEVKEENKEITSTGEHEEQLSEEEKEEEDDEDSEKECLEIYKSQSPAAEDKETEEKEEINNTKVPSVSSPDEEEKKEESEGEEEEDMEIYQAKLPSAEVKETREDEEKESLEIRKTEIFAAGGEKANKEDEEVEDECWDVKRAQMVASEHKEAEYEEEALEVNTEMAVVNEVNETEYEKEEHLEIYTEKTQEAEGSDTEDEAEKEEQSLALNKEKSLAQGWKEAEDDREEDLEINKEIFQEADGEKTESEEENEEEVMEINKEEVHSSVGKEKEEDEEGYLETGIEKEAIQDQSDEEDTHDKENTDMKEIVSEQNLAVSCSLDNDKENDNVETKSVDGDITAKAVPVRDEETILLTKDETENVLISTEENREEASWITEEMNRAVSNVFEETISLTKKEEQFGGFPSSGESIKSDEEKVFLSTTSQEEPCILDDGKQGKEEELSENNYVEHLTMSESKECTQEFNIGEDVAEMMVQVPPLDSLQDNYLASLKVNKHEEMSADLDIDSVPSDDDFIPISETKHEDSEANILVQDFADDANTCLKSTGNLLNENSEVSAKEYDDEDIIRTEAKVSQEDSIILNEDTLDIRHLDAKHEVQTISIDNDSESTEDDESPNASKAYQAPKHNDEEGCEVITTSDEENQSHEEEGTPDYIEGHTAEYRTEGNVLTYTLQETELKTDEVLQLGSVAQTVSDAGEETYPEDNLLENLPPRSDSDKCREDIIDGKHSLDVHGLTERNVSKESNLIQQVEGVIVHGKEITTGIQQFEEHNVDGFTKEVSESGVTINGVHLDEDMDEQDFINGIKEETVQEKELPPMSKLRSSEEAQDIMLHEHGKGAFQSDFVAKVLHEGPTDNLNQQDIMSEVPTQICLNASDDNEPSFVEKNHSADQWAQEDTLNLEDFTLSGKDKKESSENVAII